MGNVQQLENQEAIEKIKELAEGINICMFCTNVKELPFESRPMATQKVDDEGNLWFISGADSHKNWEIKTDDQVQLIYSKPSDYEFLSITGYATISKDRAKIEELWTPIAKAWFPEGKDDPRVTVIKVVPNDAYYWDTKDGKMVSYLKIAAAALTGSAHDDGGIEGRLKI